jgi:hypothetical protein
MAEGEDILEEAALAGVSLPKETLAALSSSGVPRELRLPDWAGPTLFTSEIGGGRLVSTTEAGALVSRTGKNEGYLIGSVRDTTGEVSAPYSVFCLRREVGDVVLLDIRDASHDCFVNSNLHAFLASMDALRTSWNHLMADSPEREAFVASFRKLLTALDARALDDEANYWPGWLEELE